MVFSSLRTQFDHPSGIFLILMIVRGDVIQKAVAQLVGGPYCITPVALSFGWVSYTVSALFSAIGDGRMMPDVECASIVMNADTGDKRVNKSWVLSRLLRDWEKRATYDYSEPALVVAIFKVREEDRKQRDMTDRARRRVQDLEKNKKAKVDAGTMQAGVPELDLQWYTGILVIIAQLIIATIAGIVFKLWLTMTVTIVGTILCLAGGALPQLKQEKWSCRKMSEGVPDGGAPKHKTIILTQGNGHRHVMIVHSSGRGLNLEDLATGRLVNRRSTLPCLLLLTVCWLVILLIVGGKFSENTWCLVAVGALGSAQNMFAAGHHRAPSTTGIHLDKPVYVLPEPPKQDHQSKEVANKVFQVLKKTESIMSEKYCVNRVGIFLLPVFFESLRPNEKAWRDQLEAKYTREENAQGYPADTSLKQAETLVHTSMDHSVRKGPIATGSLSDHTPQRREQSSGEPEKLELMAPGSVTTASGVELASSCT